MAESLIVKNKRDGTLTLLDFGGVNTYVVSFEAGDLSIAVPGPTVSNYLDRGRFVAPRPAIRYVDDQPITGSFTAYMRDVNEAAGGGGEASLLQIINRTGLVNTTWVSRMTATGEVFALLLRWDIEGTNHGDPTDHRIELDQCVVTGSVSEGDPSTISINFTSYALYPSSVT